MSTARPDFVPALRPPAEAGSPLCFHFSPGGDLLVHPGDPPRPADLAPPAPPQGEATTTGLYLGQLGTRACFAHWGPATAPDGTEYASLRGLMLRLPEPLGALAGRARQLLEWDRDYRFCGRCGTPMRDKDDERARVCPACQHLGYPRLNPAIIVGITHHGRLLLCRNARHRGGFFSLVAGFVEVGESLEGAVRREAEEEVGLSLERVGYVGSQPWPFPSGLMIGFTAEATSAAIRVDGDEIAEAGWYGPDDHPPVPPHGSISRTIIDAVLASLPR